MPTYGRSADPAPGDWVGEGPGPRPGYNNLSVNPYGAPEGRGATMRTDRATSLSFSGSVSAHADRRGAAKRRK